MGTQDIDVELVERFTGQRRVRSLHAAQSELDVADSAYRLTRERHQTLARQVKRDRTLELWLGFRIWTAALPQRYHVAGWALLVIVATIIASFTSLMVVFLWGGSTPVLLTVIFGPFLLVFFTPIFFPLDATPLRIRLTRTVDARLQAERNRSALAPLLEEARQLTIEARRVRDGMIQAQEFPLIRLLSADVRSMSGTEFEQYLAEVFRFLGYQVRSTGGAGDQGVDLIVVDNDGVEIAVQAKCYSGSVNNAAVQQAHTGMSVHRCRRCAVVTSSVFTRSALEAAQAVGCRLVSGPELPALVRGVLRI